MANLRLKRVYDPPAPDDGYRVLVDRLWPRGISKEAARIDHWAKEASPSTALRKEFHGHPDRWDEFRAAYALDRREPAHSAALAIRAEAAKGVVTLLYAAKDETRNNAAALRAWLAALKPWIARTVP